MGFGKVKHYSLRKIDETNADYRIIIGERSNGKSFAVLKRIVENFCKNGEQGAIIRREAEDIKTTHANHFFDSLICDGNGKNNIKKLTKDEYDNVKYKSGAFYFSRFDETLQKDILENEPFCYCFAIAQADHYKSTSYPGVTTVLFDEFMTRKKRFMLLDDEFLGFTSILSTIIRDRNNVIIYMCANTVATTSIYFNEMGLNHITQMKQGSIDVYRYGENSTLTVAVEYCDKANKQGKPSDKYFAFDNPKLKMITDGAFELDIYPHCPCKILPKNIRYTFFIKFEVYILQCEICYVDGNRFLYIHQKTTPLKNPDKDLIYQLDYDYRKNYARNIYRPTSKTQQAILNYFMTDRVYYQDNWTGEAVSNYLGMCRKI